MYKFRRMDQGDVAAALRIQGRCYPANLLEDEATIRARLASSPDTAWVAEDENDTCAYLVVYRSVLGNITPLSGLFDIPVQADSLYLHDLAVDSSAQSAGIGPKLVRFAWAQAQEEGLKYSALVAVQGSCDFWQRLGYEVLEGLGLSQATNLNSYGEASRYMVKQLA